jgi:hypothetical protein
MLTRLIIAAALVAFSAYGSQAADQEFYDSIRTRLTPEEKLPPRSMITVPEKEEEEDEESPGLSLEEVMEERKTLCRLNPRAPECVEYGVLVQKNTVDEICARDPLGEKCRKLSDNRLNRMFKRQAACRAGLNSRKCASARNQRRREGKYQAR